MTETTARVGAIDEMVTTFSKRATRLETEAGRVKTRDGPTGASVERARELRPQSWG